MHTMHATTTSTDAATGPWWRRPGREFARGLAERRRERGAARELAGLGTRGLRDVGLDLDGPERAAWLGRRY